MCVYKLPCFFLYFARVDYSAPIFGFLKLLWLYCVTPEAQKYSFYAQEGIFFV